MKSFLNNKDYFKHFAPYIIICLAYILCLCISFKKWIFFPWDVGREMLVPYKLLQGEVLYRDVFYHYNPLAPYLLSWLWSLYPVTLNTLYAFGIIVSIVCVCSVYKLCLKISGYLFASIVTLFFINFYVFIPTRGNLIFPYAFAYSLATTLTFVVLILSIRYFEQSEYSVLILISLLVGTLFVTKIEYALASFATILFVIFIKNIRRGKSRFLLSEFITFSLLTSIIPVLTLILFSLKGVNPLFIVKSLFPSDYLDYRGGILKASFLEAFSWAAIKREIFFLIIIFLFTMNLISFFKKIFKTHSTANSKFAIFFNILVFFATFIIARQYRHYSDIISASVVISLPCLVFFLIKIKKINQPSHIYLGFILFNSFLLCMRNMPSLCYSQAFSIFSLLLIVWFMLYAVPAWMDKSLPPKAWVFYRRIIYFVLYAGLLSFFLVFFRIYNEMNFSLKTDRGILYTSPSYGEVYSKVIDWLKNNTGRQDTLLILPEGAWLNFLLDRKYPYYQTQGLPFFISSIEKQFKSKPCDVVVLVWPWGCRFWPWGQSKPPMIFRSQVFENLLTRGYDKVFEYRMHGYTYLGLSKIKLDNYAIIYKKKKI
jgi:hypothetical protein